MRSSATAASDPAVSDDGIIQHSSAATIFGAPVYHFSQATHSVSARTDPRLVELAQPFPGGNVFAIRFLQNERLPHFHNLVS